MAFTPDAAQPGRPGDRSSRAELVALLNESQRLGFLGRRPIGEVIDHAGAFVDALAASHGTVVDLGAGGGVPGLVVAHDRPDLRLVLVERRQTRADFLRRAVSRLGWSDRVTVINDDVDRLTTGIPSHDAVSDVLPANAAIARGFGPPEATLALAARLVRPGGRVVISEPPTDHARLRWPDRLLVDVGCTRLDHADPSVAVFQITRST